MKKIPDFNAINEAAEFWGTKSSADYWHDMEDCNDTFKRPPLKTLSLKMDPNMFNKLKVFSKRKGLSCSSYMRLLLSQGIEREIKEI